MNALVQQVIEGRARDLGDGFIVARILPYATRRMVGPFVFLDQMGPAVHAPGQGLDVRPHPHIGLSTVTYLFEGAIEHRDSTGARQVIRPGDVNWMTAGSGIVHSERTPAPERTQGQRLHGLQAWVALPAHAEETDPSFHHHPAATLPSITLDGARRTLIAGSAFGAESPAKTWSQMFYIDVEAEAGATVALPDDHAERAAYIVSGALALDGQSYHAGQMLVLAPGARDPAGDGAVPHRLARRCAVSGATPHLVEPGLEPAGADRGRQGRLARPALPGCARRDRVHPPAGGVKPARVTHQSARRRSGRVLPIRQAGGVAKRGWVEPSCTHPGLRPPLP